MRHDFHSFGLGLCNKHSIKWVAMQQWQSPQSNSMLRVEFNFLNTALFCANPNIIRQKRHHHSVLLMLDGNFSNANRTEEQLIRTTGKNMQSRSGQRPTFADHPQQDMRIQQHPHNGLSNDASKSASISRSIALSSSQVGSFHFPSIIPILTLGFFDVCGAASETRRKINWYAPPSGN